MMDGYADMLDETGVDAIRRDFARISQENGGRGLVLLCFEDLAKAHCHRRLFADFWQARTGQAVPELVG